jgi:hypothetical protein
MGTPGKKKRQPVKVWPPPQNGEKYGANRLQRQLFIDELPIEERPHLHSQDVCLFIGAAGAGKCFGKGTPILLFDGTTKKVEDIIVGEHLMGPDSKPRTVKELARGREKMFKITPVKGESFVCNESHIMSFKTSGYRLHSYSEYSTGKRKRVEVHSNGDIKNISLKDFLGLPRRQQRQLKLWRSDVIEFPKHERPLEMDPYFLGLWLGDGSSNCPEVTTMDPEIVTYLRSYAEALSLKLHIAEKGRSKASAYRISSGNIGGGSGSNGALTALQKCDVIYNKHIPREYLTSSPEERRAVLAGLVDSDGHADGNGGVDIVQKNERLANDIVFLARSLGFAAYIHPCRKHCMYKGECKEGTYYRIYISGDLSEIPTLLPRKQFNVRQQPKSVLVTGFSVEDLGEGDYYGFEIEGPDRLFLLGDFTVTHNSIAAVARVLSVCLKYPGTKAIVGAINHPMLSRTVIPAYRDRLSLPGGNWNHPTVRRGPTDKRPTIEMFNGSEIRFLNLSDYTILRGFSCDLITVEEANLLDSADALEELIRRLRNHATPVKQVILTMNPGDESNWTFEKFKLIQWTEDYTGPPIPIGTPCRCDVCSFCLNDNLGEFEWVDRKCPNCGKPKTIAKGKNGEEFDCPGHQQFFRVLQTRSADNRHNPTDYVQNMRSSLDADSYKSFVEGKIGVGNRHGKIYKSFSRSVHVNLESVPIDPNQDIIISFDWNVEPLCSVIIQDTPNGPIVKDELVDWVRDAEELMDVFIQRYPRNSFTGTVHIYGDANGSWGGGKQSKKKTNYQLVYDKLTTNGYIVQMHLALRNANRNPAITARVNCVNRVLRTADGGVRLMINKEAAHLIKSLEGVVWNDQGTKEKEHCDRNAKRSTNKQMIHVLTHPSTALGYYIEKAYPIIKDKTPVKFVVIPNKETIIEEEGSIRSISPPVAKVREEARGKEGSILRRLNETRGLSISRRVLRERQEAERIEAEAREQRIAEKLRANSS